MSDISSSTDERVKSRPVCIDRKADTVRSDYNQGRILCNNVEHFVIESLRTKENPGAKGFRAVPLSDGAILKMMVPFKAAACDCQRRAISKFASISTPGTYQTEWVCPGNNYKGLKFGDTVPSVPKKVMPIAFSLSPEDKNVLNSKFPDWIFITTSSGSHDHPVAHVSSQVANHNLVTGLPNGKYLDIYGDPAANSRHNQLANKRTIDTQVSLMTAKDHLRCAFKWGDHARWNVGLRDIGVNVANHPANGKRMKSYDGLLMLQCIYYPDLREVVGVLNACKPKGRKLWATLHKFEGSKGTINNGEQQWERYNDGRTERIRQTNVLTGESYDHAPPDMWFKQSTWCPYTPDQLMQMVEKDPMVLDRHDSLAWTINKACDDTFVLQITTVPNQVAVAEAADKPELAREVNSSEWVKEKGRVELSIADTPVVVTVPTPLVPLFDDLRKSMVNQARTAEKFKAHSQRTVLKCSGVMKTHSLTADEVSDLALASFWVDAKRDVVNATSLNSWGQGFASSTGRFFKTAPTIDRSSLRLMAKLAIHALDAKNLKDGTRRVIQLIADTI
jgi:hypothetical protein